MDIKNVGKSAAQFDAFSSLARTDDVLAVIGIIMLVGVLVSSYGAFWQGRLAAAQYKKEYSPSTDPNGLKKTVGYVITMSAITLLIIGLIVYIFRKQIKNTQDTEPAL